jgi:hypothetical protein
VAGFIEKLDRRLQVVGGFWDEASSVGKSPKVTRVKLFQWEARIEYNYYISNVSKDYDDSQ